MFNRKMNINFIGNRNKFFIASAILMVLIIVSAFIFGIQLDIKFRGGTMIDYSYEGETGAVDLEKVKSISEETLDEAVRVEEKYNKLTETNGLRITLVSNKGISNEMQGNLDNKLVEEFAEQGINMLEVSSVNPSMGREFFLKCLVAVTVGGLLMILYIGIRFRNIGGFSAGIMAVAALLHDVMIVLGTFIIFRMPLNDNFIAVLLTIVGYSINSTIVIYDRIRENKRLYKRGKPLAEVVNMSVNQTFSRCVNTTLTTLIVMVVICVVAGISGVTSIMSFVIPIIAGILSGFYSSSFLASELWVTWKERKASK